VSCGSVPDVVLAPGATGGYVEYLQRRLWLVGHDVVVDGRFGPRTRAAVRSYQCSLGLASGDVDGVVSGELWVGLFG
jgi:peptidoglycan hydrolase-like protein with peptidoglycan-binding domain